MSFSLLKCYYQVIERLYSSITLQSWLHVACGFWKEKKEKKESGFTKRESENTSTELHRANCRTSWADLQRWWRKQLLWRKLGEVIKRRSAHTSTTIFLCMSRPPTTWKQNKERVIKVDVHSDGKMVRTSHTRKSTDVTKCIRDSSGPWSIPSSHDGWAAW